MSSTLGELAEERAAVRRAVERLRLSPVMFELGARPHPPRELYRAYLEQSHVFVGVFWQRYGWVAPGESVSGLEDEYRLSFAMPQLVYIKEPAPDREPALAALLREIQTRDQTSYRRFRTTEELEELVSSDLAVLLSERFETRQSSGPASVARAPVPAVLTPTIGREAEISTVVELLDGGARLVTVTGPGGAGKTRLSLEVANLRSRAGADVFYAPLADVSSPDLVMPTLADALGIKELSGRSALETVVSYFGSSRAMLVLDNLEQVIAVAPELSRLIERATGLQVLTTSRQALRIRGEHEVLIGPLATPGADRELDEIARSPAVRLFVDRARALGARFELTSGNAVAVAELCRRLDGLPLAVELVAARVRLLPPRDLARRLGTVLDLPGAMTDLPERQRTLRATLDWSHGLLDAGERTLFARLGVFGGGATLAAIEAVGLSDGQDVEEVLAGLIDQSLVVADDSAALGGEPRFRMLEPVREYAAELLARRDDADAARRRHLDHFSRLGREAQPYLCGPDQRTWLERFDAERANLRIAIGYGLDHGALAEVLQLVWDTLVYFYVRDAIEEPRRWLLRLAEGRSPLDETGQAVLDLGLVIVGEASSDREAVELLAGALEVFDRDGLDLEAAVAQHHLGVRHWRSGDTALAIETLEDASRRYARIEHDWGVATSEMTLGAVHAALGDTDAATRHHQRSLVHSRRIDNWPQVAQALQGMALVEALNGRTDQARGSLDEAVAIVLASHSVTGATYCLEVLAALAAAGGDVEEAVRLVIGARTIRRELAIPEWTAAADAAEPIVAAARRALSEDRFAELWQEGTSCDPLARLRGDLTEGSAVGR